MEEGRSNSEWGGQGGLRKSHLSRDWRWGRRESWRYWGPARQAVPTASSKEHLRNAKEFVYPEWRGGRRGEEMESERSQVEVMGALYMDFGLCPDWDGGKREL